MIQQILVIAWERLDRIDLLLEQTVSFVKSSKALVLANIGPGVLKYGNISIGKNLGKISEHLSIQRFAVHRLDSGID